MILLGRGRGEALATLGGFGLWLRLGRLFDFFSAFIFASHVCKCATKMRLEESLLGKLADIFRCRFLIRQWPHRCAPDRSAHRFFRWRRDTRSARRAWSTDKTG